MSAYDPKKIKSFKALQNYVIVTEMNFKEKITSGGIIIQSTNGKLEGIHPRWGKVYAVGDKQQDVRPGQYVLVKHGRWTRGTSIEDLEGEKIIRRVDANDILLVSDEPVSDDTIGRGV